MKIYTDGSCVGNPGSGGWGFLIVKDDKVIYNAVGKFELTTNNKMELIAVIESLKFCIKNYSDKKISVCTDSNYVLNSMKTWVHGWKKKNWCKADGKPIENPELIKELYLLCYNSGLEIDWIKVVAHQNSGSPDYDSFNEYVDNLATGKKQPTINTVTKEVITLDKILTKIKNNFKISNNELLHLKENSKNPVSIALIDEVIELRKIIESDKK